MRQCWQIVTQKFCLTGEMSFPFEPKFYASMGRASPPLHLLQDPVGCPSPVPFPKCRLCCCYRCALCSLFGSATNPSLQRRWSPMGWWSRCSYCPQHNVWGHLKQDLEGVLGLLRNTLLTQVLAACPGSSSRHKSFAERPAWGTLCCGTTGCRTPEETGTLLPPEN